MFDPISLLKEKTCLISRTRLNFGQIGPPTTELGALEYLKIPYRHTGENGVSTFSRLFSNYRTTVRDQKDFHDAEFPYTSMYFHNYMKIYYSTARQHILILLVSFESVINTEIVCILSSNSIHVF